MIFDRWTEKNVLGRGRNQFQGNILAFDAEENYETYVKTVCHRAEFFTQKLRNMKRVISSRSICSAERQL
jgi:hypothetical protein